MGSRFHLTHYRMLFSKLRFFSRLNHSFALSRFSTYLGIIVCFAERSLGTSTLFDIPGVCVYFRCWWFSFWPVHVFRFFSLCVWFVRLIFVHCMPCTGFLCWSVSYFRPSSFTLHKVSCTNFPFQRKNNANRPNVDLQQSHHFKSIP